MNSGKHASYLIVCLINEVIWKWEKLKTVKTVISGKKMVFPDVYAIKPS